MEYHKQTAPDVLKLRMSAEKKVASRPAFDEEIIAHLDAKRLYHELQVHQIELEMQLSELQKSHQALDLLLEQYAEIYDFAPVCYMSLDRKGRILKCNFSSADLIGAPRAKVIRRPLAGLVAAADLPVFATFMAQVFDQHPFKASCRLNLLVKGADGTSVQLEALAAESGQECLLTILVAPDSTASEKNRSNPPCRQGDAVACRSGFSPALGTAALRPVAALSRRERETLKLVVDGYTNAAIAETMNISQKSVETYRSRLMLKLGINNVPDLVKYALLNDIISL